MNVVTSALDANIDDVDGMKSASHSEMFMQNTLISRTISIISCFTFPFPSFSQSVVIANMRMWVRIYLRCEMRGLKIKTEHHRTIFNKQMFSPCDIPVKHFLPSSFKTLFFFLLIRLFLFLALSHLFILLCSKDCNIFHFMCRIRHKPFWWSEIKSISYMFFMWKFMTLGFVRFCFILFFFILKCLLAFYLISKLKKFSGKMDVVFKGFKDFPSSSLLSHKNWMEIKSSLIWILTYDKVEDINWLSEWERRLSGE